jgi:N-acetylmuramoyl-L-alanine amidase
MRELKRIILHCSATPEGRDVTTEEIRRWHTSPPRNWRDIGYHYVIRLDGSIEQGRPLDLAGAHVRGHNKDSVGVVYVGGTDADGKPKDTMTHQQLFSLYKVVVSLRNLFGPLTLHGHNEFSNKACPSFIVSEKLPYLVDHV